MTRNPDTLRNTLWTEFETVSATPAVGWRDRFHKAFSLAVLAVPLLTTEGKPAAGFSAAQLSPDDVAPVNPTVEALKAIICSKRLNPKLEQKLRNARLRPTKDGRALLIDWK